MLIVKNSIVSDDIVECRFCCNLQHCRGRCCIEGDSGAPLLEEETEILRRLLPLFMPFMTEEGQAAVQRQGVSVRDRDGDLGTPLCDDGACAYLYYDDEGMAWCAIEKAYREGVLGKEEFIKPISCHLYPIRIQDYGEFTAVNYHQWDICSMAKGQGQPLYITLKEPLVRRFGQAWYEELLEEIAKR